MIRQRVQFQRLIALLKNHIAQKADFNTHFKPYPKKIFKITVRKCPLAVAQQEQRGCQGEAPSPPPGYFLPHTLQRLDCLWGRSCVWCAGTPDSSSRPHFPLGVWHWRAETWEELLCPCGAGVQLLQGEAGCQPAVHPRLCILVCAPAPAWMWGKLPTGSVPWWDQPGTVCPSPAVGI